MPACNNINFKQVILIISEGPTEKISLENILRTIYNDKKIKFQYCYGDITTENGVTINNVEKKIKDTVNAFIKRDKGFRKSDIKRIIHIVDTDGCFIPDSNIVVDNAVDRFIYKDDNIVVNNYANCKKRNMKKRQILNHLILVNKITDIEYGVFYMSTNLEHVLHNIQNASKPQKSELASEFKEKYIGKENEFVIDLKNDDLRYDGSYEDSWNFIQEGTNSLKRKTNLNIALKE